MNEQPEYAKRDSRPYHVVLLFNDGSTRRLPWVYSDPEHAFCAAKQYLGEYPFAEIVVIHTMTNTAVINRKANNKGGNQ